MDIACGIYAKMRFHVTEFRTTEQNRDLNAQLEECSAQLEALLQVVAYTTATVRPDVTQDPRTTRPRVGPHTDDTQPQNRHTAQMDTDEGQTHTTDTDARHRHTLLDLAEAAITA